MSSSVTLTGRVATDPVLTFDSNGGAICRFTVVTDRRVRNQQTQQFESQDTTWWRCTCWKALAEQAAEHLDKGKAVIVTGNAYQDDYTDKDGNQRTSLAVKVNDIALSIRWGDKPQGQQTTAQAPKKQSRQQQQQYDDPPF